MHKWEKEKHEFLEHGKEVPRSLNQLVFLRGKILDSS